MFMFISIGFRPAFILKYSTFKIMKFGGSATTITRIPLLQFMEVDKLPTYEGVIQYLFKQKRTKHFLFGNGFSMDDVGPHNAYKPGFAFEAGIRPLLPLSIKSRIWYQGESNSLEPERVAEYGSLQKLLIDDYRAKWMNPDLPSYWVQLSSIDTTDYQSQYWPQFRDEQWKRCIK